MIAWTLYSAYKYTVCSVSCHSFLVTCVCIPHYLNNSRLGKSCNQVGLGEGVVATSTAIDD